MDYVWQSSQDTIGNDCAGADTRCQFGWIVMAVYTAVRCAVSWREGDNPMIHPLAFYRRNGIFIEFLKKFYQTKQIPYTHPFMCIALEKTQYFYISSCGNFLCMSKMIGANYTIQLEEECDQDRACLRIVAIRAYFIIVVWYGSGNMWASV